MTEFILGVLLGILVGFAVFWFFHEAGRVDR